MSTHHDREEEVDAFYASYHRAASQGHWWFRGRRALVDEVLRRHDIRGGRVADLGSGQTTLFPPGFEVVRTDRKSLGRGEPFVQGEVTRLPFRTGAFDGGGLFDVLEHLDHPAETLREASRVVRPGGFLMITVPAHSWLWSWHDELAGHYTRYERDSLQLLLEQAELRPTWVNFFFRFMVIPALARKVIRVEDEFRMPPPLFNELLSGVARRSAIKALESRHEWGLSLAALAYRP
ncbi:MAG: class I SAM-dependent methyltransferase [Actinomycetota bacterium]|nr:class I SAM-dependent methyltransferase [Actinomycetota bacterium]